ncbi:Clp protease N-terminal domain-containing protein [Actinoplanes solisilvae]|uniref:Clp protease N-terminal domain-containing protein n=1 Tax=Actinoplanes solisilvae TaxID=2486853 RepID=UPI000FDC50C9|nr:Clp protease N-terminal domain-containing protein [Actinoplanes solisilvae]
MPKINVYLPDELAEAVRESGLPVSPICQRALEQALRRMTAIRQAVLSDLDPAALAERLPGFTARLLEVLTIAADRAKRRDATTVTTGDLLYGLVNERQNLGRQVLAAMEVDPDVLSVPEDDEPAVATDALRFSAPAAAAMELTVGEAIGLGHNYVGCEHLVIGLAAEPDGIAGTLLRERGADGKAVRRAVTAAVAGYAHLRATAGGGNPLLAQLIQRVERLERQLAG